MFDDLVLLAKAGLTVYHGSVADVEKYFSDLGINVPERVNPPDYFIDILEGIVKPSISSDVTYEGLPIYWMHHKGYPIPKDLQRKVGGASSSTMVNSNNGKSLAGGPHEEQSFAGEVWQDVKCNVEMHRHNILHNFLKWKDLSNRRTPGVLKQYKYFLGRYCPLLFPSESKTKNLKTKAKIER